MLVVDLAIQAVIAVIIPYIISMSIYKREKRKIQWAFALSFPINFLAQAKMAVLFWGMMSSFETWICDVFIFVMPLIGEGLFLYNSKALHDGEAARLEKQQKLQKQYQSTDETVAPTEQNVEEVIPIVTTTEVVVPAETDVDGTMPAVTEERTAEVQTPTEPIIMTEAPALKYRFCRKCGFELLKDSAFCSKCGSPVVKKIVCPSCGKELTEQSVFCHYCGTKI